MTEDQDHPKILAAKQNPDHSTGRGEIIVVGEVLGVSQCPDSAAGGDAVKLVNPVEMGISSAGGACRSRGAVGVCPCEQCHAVAAPHTSMLYPFANPPRALSDPIR